MQTFIVVRIGAVDDNDEFDERFFSAFAVALDGDFVQLGLRDDAHHRVNVNS